MADENKTTPNENDAPRLYSVNATWRKDNKRFKKDIIVCAKSDKEAREIGEARLYADNAQELQVRIRDLGKPRNHVTYFSSETLRVNAFGTTGTDSDIDNDTMTTFCDFAVRWGSEIGWRSTNQNAVEQDKIYLIRLEHTPNLSNMLLEWAKECITNYETNKAAFFRRKLSEYLGTAVTDIHDMIPVSDSEYSRVMKKAQDDAEKIVATARIEAKQIKDALLEEQKNLAAIAAALNGTPIKPVPAAEPLQEVKIPEQTSGNNTSDTNADTSDTQTTSQDTQTTSDNQIKKTETETTHINVYDDADKDTAETTTSNDTEPTAESAAENAVKNTEQNDAQSQETTDVADTETQSNDNTDDNDYADAFGDDEDENEDDSEFYEEDLPPEEIIPDEDEDPFSDGLDGPDDLDGFADNNRQDEPQDNNQDNDDAYDDIMQERQEQEADIIPINVSPVRDDEMLVKTYKNAICRLKPDVLYKDLKTLSMLFEIPPHGNIVNAVQKVIPAYTAFKKTITVQGMTNEAISAAITEFIANKCMPHNGKSALRAIYEKHKKIDDYDDDEAL